MSLWIESAHQSLVRAGGDACGDVARTFQTEEQFSAVLVSSAEGGAQGRAGATSVADEIASKLERGATLDVVVETALAALPVGEHMSFSALQVVGGDQVHLVECDAPPLFLVQNGQPVLLPVVEDVVQGRLVRRCEFLVRDGDDLAMVSEGFLRPRGWRWSWPDIAVAVRRWTDTNCDAGELLGALMRSYRRLNPEAPQQDVTVVAMHARPMRTVTVWTGPPADPAQDEAALERLMAEQGVRVICGGTTAQVAARLLGAELEIEPRPREGWAEVPPTSRLEGVDLVTEGLVTLGKARERMAGVERARDLPRREDGATRLGRALLTADRVHFVVGLVVNLQQTDDSGAVPLRRGVVEKLMNDLQGRQKIISVEYV